MIEIKTNNKPVELVEVVARMNTGERQIFIDTLVAKWPFLANQLSGMLDVSLNNETFADFVKRTVNRDISECTEAQLTLLKNRYNEL